MTRIGRLHRIHGERPDRIGEQSRFDVQVDSFARSRQAETDRTAESVSVPGSFKEGGKRVNLGSREALAGAGPQAYRGAMSEDRALRAIDRIERAFARIEAAHAGQNAAPGGSELIELRHTHQALRSTVEDAIARIDRLLVSEGAA